MNNETDTKLRGITAAERHEPKQKAIALRRAESLIRKEARDTSAVIQARTLRQLADQIGSWAERLAE